MVRTTSLSSYSITMRTLVKAGAKIRINRGYDSHKYGVIKQPTKDHRNRYYVKFSRFSQTLINICITAGVDIIM